MNGGVVMAIFLQSTPTPGRGLSRHGVENEIDSPPRLQRPFDGPSSATIDSRSRRRESTAVQPQPCNALPRPKTRAAPHPPANQPPFNLDAHPRRRPPVPQLWVQGKPWLLDTPTPLLLRSHAHIDQTQ